MVVPRSRLRAHVDAQARVEVGQRLVQQQQLRVRRHRARDGHTLLLAAGQLVGIAFFVFGDAHHPQGVLHAPIDLVPGQLLDLQAEGDVVVDRHVRPQRVGLEHQVQPALAGLQIEGLRGVDGRPAVDQHHATLRALQAGDHAQRGRLAAARRPQQRHEVAVLDGQRQILQHMVVAIVFVDALQFDLAHTFDPFGE